MPKRTLSQQDFLDCSRTRHGDTYRYDNAVYTKASNPVEITCLVHGAFIQQASHHMRGHGCPTCAKNITAAARRKDKNSMIAMMQAKQPEYDCSQIVYVSGCTPIVRTCVVHGTFSSRPNDIINYNTGCPKCAHANSRKTTTQFIKDAQRFHGTLYDYTDTIYVSTSQPVQITCKEHGPFLQLATNHITGHGCPSCGLAARRASAEKRRTTTARFIEKAQAVHGGRYAYDCTTYVTTHAKVEITCDTHGGFHQRASNHLAGQGCPKCKVQGIYSSKWFTAHPAEAVKPGILYFMEFSHPITNEQFWKIGITKRAVADRWNYPISYIITQQYQWIGSLEAVYNTEQHCLTTLILNSERYRPALPIGGDTECIKLTTDRSVEIITELCTHHNSS